MTAAAGIANHGRADHPDRRTKPRATASSVHTCVHNGGGHGIDSNPSRSGGRQECVAAARVSGHAKGQRPALFVWLIGGMSVAFLVPFVLADQLALQRELYYAIYVGAVVGLFVGWARDTGQSPGR